MFKDKITLEQALRLEAKGKITIADPAPESLGPVGDTGKTWKENFIATIQA